MKPKPSGIEPIALRRATLADSDKVRYRVYSSPTESIVVIAPSALMALKISGIEKPFKIVRDLSVVGATIQAQKISPPQAGDTRVPIAIERQEKEKQLMTELPAPQPKSSGVSENFKPMNIADLQHDGLPRARILPPDLLTEIIEQHAKSTPAAAETHAPMLQPTEPEMPPPVMQPTVEPAPTVVAKPAGPALSTEEKLLQMADTVLPSSAEPLPETPVVLSTDDVEKLLNE